MEEAGKTWDCAMTEETKSLPLEDIDATGVAAYQGALRMYALCIKFGLGQVEVSVAFPPRAKTSAAVWFALVALDSSYSILFSSVKFLPSSTAALGLLASYTACSMFWGEFALKHG